MAALDEPTRLAPQRVRRPGRAVVRLLTNTDHKVIGNLYFITAFVFFMFGGLLALLIRAVLWAPCLPLWDNPAKYNPMFRQHCTVVCFPFPPPLFPGFVGCLHAGLAATPGRPLHWPGADNELIAGFHTGYSGMKFGIFFIGECVGIVLISAMIVTLFLGGWLGPVLPPLLWFLVKLAFFVGFFILLRAALPRPRYDQLMAYGWKVMLPIALLNLLGTGAVLLVARRRQGPAIFIDLRPIQSGFLPRFCIPGTVQ